MQHQAHRCLHLTFFRGATVFSCCGREVENCNARQARGLTSTRARGQDARQLHYRNPIPTHAPFKYSVQTGLCNAYALCWRRRLRCASHNAWPLLTLHNTPAPQLALQASPPRAPHRRIYTVVLSPEIFFFSSSTSAMSSSRDSCTTVKGSSRFVVCLTSPPASSGQRIPRTPPRIGQTRRC